MESLSNSFKKKPINRLDVSEKVRPQSLFLRQHPLFLNLPPCSILSNDIRFLCAMLVLIDPFRWFAEQARRISGRIVESRMQGG